MTIFTRPDGRPDRLDHAERRRRHQRRVLRQLWPGLSRLRLPPRLPELLRAARLLRAPGGVVHAMTTEYIVVIGHAVGNERDGFRISHEWDLRQFDRKSEAVSHGFELAESDDFNIGVIENGRLASLWWMAERLDETPESLAEIGAEIGLRP